MGITYSVLKNNFVKCLAFILASKTSNLEPPCYTFLGFPLVQKYGNLKCLCEKFGASGFWRSKVLPRKSGKHKLLKIQLFFFLRIQETLVEYQF